MPEKRNCKRDKLRALENINCKRDKIRALVGNLFRP